MRDRTGALEGVLFAFLAATAGAVLLYVGRGTIFMGDEWAYVGRFVDLSAADSLLRSPGSDYLMVVPLFLYERLLDLFGATSYVPFRVVAVGVHLLCALLLFVLLRRRVGAVPATLAATLLLFLAGGPPGVHAAEGVTMTARRLPMLIGLAFGLGGLVALDRRTLRADAVACLMLSLAVLSHPVALAFVAVALVSVAARGRPERRRRAFVFAVPTAILCAGTLAFGHPATGLSLARFATAPLFVARSFAAAAAALAGTLNSPPLGSADAPVQAVAGLAALVPIGWAVMRGRRTSSGPGAGLLAACAGLLTLFVATALQPGSGSVGSPETSRYVYPEAILLLLVVAEALRDVRFGRWGLVAVAVLVPFAITADALQLRNVGSILRRRSLAMRVELGVYERSEAAGSAVLHGAVPAALWPRDVRLPTPPALHSAHAFGGLDAGTYDRIADRWGSPAMPRVELAHVRDRLADYAALLQKQAPAPRPSRPLGPSVLAAVRGRRGEKLEDRSRSPRPTPRTVARLRSPYPRRPNIVLILTDDQPVGSLHAMPYVRSRSDWSRFTNAFINYPLCCPSRATINSGQYSHHTGVEDNAQSIDFDNRTALATWMHVAGYQTGLFGKYFNNYPWHRRHSYVPPGWDRWSAFLWKGKYYDYRLNTNGVIRRYGRRPRDYATNLLGAEAVRFISHASSPFFIYYAPPSPHAPYSPEPRYRDTVSPEQIRLPPDFGGRGTGAPLWVRELPPPGSQRMRRRYAMQLETLRSVDDQVRDIFRALRRRHELSDTVVIYMTDNGIANGSHDYKGKLCPYEECVATPLLIRDPFERPRTIRHLVSNVDIAPTIAALGHAQPTHPVDGRSLIPMLRGRANGAQGAVLTRGAPHGSGPGWWGLRTGRFSYVQDLDGERELYYLRRDPYEVHNVAGQPRYRRRQRLLARRLVKIRTRRAPGEMLFPSPHRSFVHGSGGD